MNPTFHLDQDIGRKLKDHLNAHYSDPNCAKTAVELGLHLAPDGHHLLIAAQADRIFVTHNARDFITMQDAWVRWSAAWGVTPMHAGILIIPQGWPPQHAVREIVQFLGNQRNAP